MTDKNAELDGFADVPASQRPRAEKYGMPASEAHHIVRRHFQVLGEESAIDAAIMAQNIERAPAFLAALDRNAKAKG